MLAQTDAHTDIAHTEIAHTDTAHTDIAHTDIAIVGAGFCGLGAAIKLSQQGFPDLLVFEKADDIGGTWRDNAYPGCACDVPSHLYSFSFALNPNWSDTFSGQQEIWDYLIECVDRYAVRPKLRLGHVVEDAAWDDQAQRWIITTSQGTYTARVLIGATGPLSEPAIPDIPGIASFSGAVFHSARWRHDHDMTGRDIAVIGTGASAIQFVPDIQPKVGKLTLFQRTPAWVMPRFTRRVSNAEQAIFRHVPGAQRLVRFVQYWSRESLAFGFLHPAINKMGQRVSLNNLRRQVRDPQLRAKLTPDYVMGCKRVLLSNDYWPALTKPNVDVVTEGIREVQPDGIVTADGTKRAVDTIILGTGFHVTDAPVMQHIRGRGGRSLAEVWTPSMHAYKGTMVSGFPNLFFLLGPNTGLGHTSVVLMAESQLKQISKVLRHMRRNGIHAMEPTQAAQQRYTEEIDRKMAGTVWVSGGCKSWYLDSTGRNSTLWPGFATAFRLRLRRFQPADYQPVGAERDVVKV